MNQFSILVQAFYSPQDQDSEIIPIVATYHKMYPFVWHVYSFIIL